MDLELYGCIKWLDDKHGERNHQPRRTRLVKHDNNKDDNNKHLMRWESKQAMLTYCLNGGHYGENLERAFGDKLRQWKDPRDCTQPNSVIARYLWPLSVTKQSKITIRQMSSEWEANHDQYSYHLYDRTICGLIDIINDNFGLQLQHVDDLNQNIHVLCYLIESWSLHDGLKTTLINTKSKHYKYPFVLLKGNIVVKAELFLSLKIDGKVIQIMKGDTFDVHTHNNNDNGFIEKGWHAWDWVHFKQKRREWHEMSDIEECVMLVHEHVKPKQLKHKFDDNQWYPNMIDNCNIILDECNADLSKVPCGFLWQCKQHKQFGCIMPQCLQYTKKESDYWTLKMYCNNHKNDTYRLWTSNFGFLPALGDDHNLKKEKYQYW